MIRITQKDRCCGCNACRTACPLGCIDMVADSEGFLYPLINENICNQCGICEKVCPMANVLRQGNHPLAFAAWNRDAVIRAESSSGGVFSALMQSTLRQKGGVVIGAAFDSNMILRHQSAQTEAESLKFRGSKYLQSVVGDVYLEAKTYLQQSRPILFSGTPCQIAGLYSYLGKDDNNLLTCDLVCHGVPSPKVFTAYQVALERRYGAKVGRITFRRKDCGWKRYSVSLSFDNDTEYRRVFNADPFMVGFLQNTFLRPSCHSCHFSRLPRIADISLGDFWGVGNHHPEWDDDKGTSLILVQTEKGRNAFDACRDVLVVHEVDLSEAIRSNPSIFSSVPEGKHRAAFFNDLNRIPFGGVITKYMSSPPLWRRAAGKTQRVVFSIIHKLTKAFSP